MQQSALPRMGSACRLFTGPGDTGIHAVNFRVHKVLCASAKKVVEKCDLRTHCSAVSAIWNCKGQPGAPPLGHAERCVAGERFTSIVWLD